MRTLIKKVLLNTIVISAATYLLPGITYENDLKTLLLAAVVLAFVNIFLKPFIKILLVPINIITFGLTGWLVNVGVLYVTTLLVPKFSVVPFTITLYQSSLDLSIFWSFVAISLILSILTTIVSWILK